MVRLARWRTVPEALLLRRRWLVRVRHEFKQMLVAHHVLAGIHRCRSQLFGSTDVSLMRSLGRAMHVHSYHSSCILQAPRVT